MEPARGALMKICSLLARRREDYVRCRAAVVAVVGASVSDPPDPAKPVELFVRFREDASGMADELQTRLAGAIGRPVRIVATEDPDASRWPFRAEELIFIP